MAIEQIHALTNANFHNNFSLCYLSKAIPCLSTTLDVQRNKTNPPRSLYINANNCGKKNSCKRSALIRLVCHAVLAPLRNSDTLRLTNSRLVPND